MLRVRQMQLLLRRAYAKVRHESAPKETNIMRALKNFDDFYGTVYGIRWPAMRVALLTEHKYMALVNNFGDTEKTCAKLEALGAIDLRKLVDLAKERQAHENRRFVAGEVRDLGAVVAKLTKRQQEQEIAQIYSGTDADAPEHIQTKADDDNDIDNRSAVPSKTLAQVDFKKSLSQVLVEDVEIDVSRIVDPQYGTSALQEFVPAHKLKGMEDWVPESDHYKYYQANNEDFPLTIEPETDFVYPENLHIYTYEMCNTARFPAAKRSAANVLSHYMLDGGSVLPPLFLQLRPGERVLDACSAPGGKALIMLQTLYPKYLVCNDVLQSRVNRLRTVMQDFVLDFDDKWSGERVQLTQQNALLIDEYDSFDKILVDVPCTTDRHSLNENDNNIFRPTRIKERLRLPELQSMLLTNCLRLLRPGGSLVYATCTLSPVQNDGVVHMALQRAFAEHQITVTVKDLSLLIDLFTDVYKFEHPKGLKYGQMVRPYLPANFGPMYFCKLTRNDTPSRNSSSSTDQAETTPSIN